MSEGEKLVKTQHIDGKVRLKCWFLKSQQNTQVVSRKTRLSNKDKLLANSNSATISISFDMSFEIPFLWVPFSPAVSVSFYLLMLSLNNNHHECSKWLLLLFLPQPALSRFCWRSSYNKTTSYVQISVCIISYQDWALVCFIMDIICTQYASHTSLALRYCFYLDISAKIIAKIFPWW